MKVLLEGQIIKWLLIELVRAITCTFMHGFQKKKTFGPVVVHKEEKCCLKYLYSYVEGQCDT